MQVQVHGSGSGSDSRGWTRMSKIAEKQDGVVRRALRDSTTHEKVPMYVLVS